MLKTFVTYFIVIVLLMAIAGGLYYYITLPTGLDAHGGPYIELVVDPQRVGEWPEEKDTQQDMLLEIVDKLYWRVVDLEGLTEPIIYRKGSKAVVVELPGVKDIDAAIEKIISDKTLEFYYLRNVKNRNNPYGEWVMRMPLKPDGPYIFMGPEGKVVNSHEEPERVLVEVVEHKTNMPIITSRDIKPNAEAISDHENRPVINIDLDHDGTLALAEFTTNHKGDHIAIFFAGKLLAVPEVYERIEDGKATITGFRSVKEATEAVDIINAGALPIPLKVDKSKMVKSVYERDKAKSKPKSKEKKETAGDYSEEDESEDI